MSDDFKIQVSYKLGPNSQDMINVRALNGHELNALLEELGAIASSVQSTGDLVRGVAAVTTTFPGAAIVGPTPAELPANVVQMPNPAAAFQQPPTPALTPGADQAPRFCAHGQRVRKEGTTNGRKWVAYFCTLPKGSPGACEAEWVR